MQKAKATEKLLNIGVLNEQSSVSLTRNNTFGNKRSQITIAGDYEVTSPNSHKNLHSMPQIKSAFKQYTQERSSPSNLSATRSKSKQRTTSKKHTTDQSSSVSRVFTKPQMVYIFEDGQKVTENQPCYKFDLSALLRKYFVFNEKYPLNQQEGSANEMIESQIIFYERAYQELLNNCGA